MARSARPADTVEEERTGAFQAALVRLGTIAVQNPMAIGASTAFLVAMSFVSANALWYQPHAHLGALFSTRDFAPSQFPPPSVEEPATTIQIERPPVVADARLKRVQEILTQLQLYHDRVDGIAGPNTQKAIADYQRLMGLQVSGDLDDDLMTLLEAESRAIALPAPDSGSTGQTGSIVPAPTPRQANHASADPGAAARAARIVSIQKGLRAFGNDDLAVDGLVGTRTRAAIKEFQALFGLPQTGEPDEATLAKMKAEGLTN